MHGFTIRSLVVGSILAAGSVALAAEEPHDPAGHGTYGEELGTVQLPASCEEAATPQLRRGWALLHHMTYEGARSVLERIPDHPGGHHYTIHAFDYPSLAGEALPVARSYGDIAPAVPHALHMPTHIFTRLGLWEESIAYNDRSARVAHEQPVNGKVSLHHLHAVDYLVYAHLQRAEDEAAEAVARDMAGLDGPFQVEVATEKHPVTPGEVLPARELLGDMLLELGRHEEALVAYEAALERSPRRFNSLYGTGRAAELSGNAATAQKHYRALLDLAGEGAGGAGGGRERLVHAREYLADAGARSGQE